MIKEADLDGDNKVSFSGKFESLYLNVSYKFTIYIFIYLTNKEFRSILHDNRTLSKT